jgi:hypothetical protein
MPEPTSNSGSTYYNINKCRSFNQIISTTLTALSTQPCSEVEIFNRTGGSLSAYDCGFYENEYAMLIPSGSSMILRGITNSNQVSAIAGASGRIFYRTQFFSSNPLRS